MKHRTNEVCTLLATNCLASHELLRSAAAARSATQRRQHPLVAPLKDEAAYVLLGHVGQAL
jgi:hypothetical protein